MDVLNDFVLDVPRLITNIKPIMIDGKEIIRKKAVERTFFERFKDIPFFNRLDVIKNSLFSQVETKYLSDKDNVYFDYVEDKKVFYDYSKEEVNKQVDSMVSSFNNVYIYKLLWENINKYTKDNLEEVKDITLKYLGFNEVKYEDIIPIVYIRAALEGFKTYDNIKHILVDEAQDYSPLFYEMIKKTFPNASMTIMGDLNQRIDKHSNVKNKDGITKVFNDIKTVVLTKSYRSTYNITNFAKELLDTHEPIEAVHRLGDNPAIHIINDNLEKQISDVINNMKDKGYKSIAIIGKNKKSCEELFDSLKGIDSDINLITTDKCEFKTGVNVITSYLAKGLEFDGVIIADGEKYIEVEDKHLFYTACTRALHELHIFSNASLDSILPADNSLYDLV